MTIHACKKNTFTKGPQKGGPIRVTRRQDLGPSIGQEFRRKKMTGTCLRIDAGWLHSATHFFACHGAIHPKIVGANGNHQADLMAFFGAKKTSVTSGPNRNLMAWCVVDT